MIHFSLKRVAPNCENLAVFFVPVEQDTTLIVCESKRTWTVKTAGEQRPSTYSDILGSWSKIMFKDKKDKLEQTIRGCERTFVHRTATKYLKINSSVYQIFNSSKFDNHEEFEFKDLHSIKVFWWRYRAHFRNSYEIFYIYVCSVINWSVHW